MYGTVYHRSSGLGPVTLAGSTASDCGWPMPNSAVTNVHVGSGNLETMSMRDLGSLSVRLEDDGYQMCRLTSGRRQSMC